MTKQERISNGKKIAYSANGAGKTEPLSYTIHENKLKMNERPKHKTGGHQNPRGESRQKPPSSWLQQLLTQHVSGGKGSKSKNEFWDLIKIKKLLHGEGNNQQN